MPAASMPTSTDTHGVPAVGEVFEGKYRIEGVLGTGGMGVVLSAMHLHLEQRVAIKLMRPELAMESATVERFVREGRAAVKIKSEHVARVLDVAVRSGGGPYLVMEYLQGADLGHLLDAHGPLPVETAVDYVTQACEALAEAHAHGIIHRDIKPSNLFLTTNANGLPCVKVLDFGIAKAISPGDTHEARATTTTSSLLGSPLYMAPERMRASASVDPRTDIWSLGVILFELISGKFPFDAGSTPELIAMILQDAPHQLRALVPGAPAGLEAAIGRCLEKDPARRFASVADLSAAIEPYGPRVPTVTSAQIARAMMTATAARVRIERSLEATAASPLSSPAAFATTETWTGGSGAPKNGSRGRGVGWVVACVVVGLVAFVGIYKSTTGATPAASPATLSDTPPSAAPSESLSPMPPTSAASDPPAAASEKPAGTPLRPTRRENGKAAAARPQPAPAPQPTVDPFKRAPDRHD
jgi:serine/threonine-protein kinase